MADTDEGWFHQRIYRNSQLRRKGVKLRPKPPRQTNPIARPNENDNQFLKTCGVSWEAEPAVQLSLDFSGCRTKEHDPKEPASHKTEESA